MGKSMMRVVVAACVVALAMAVEQQGQDEVSELQEGEISPQGGDSTHPSAHTGGEGHGYFKGAPGIANFVGPKYGLPGYKESHTWESGTDLFSPAVFDMQYYSMAANLPLDEGTLKRAWLKKLDTAVAGACPKGKIDWTLNQYALNNPAAATSKDANYKDVPSTCKSLLENFLSTGIYAGFTGYTGFAITKASPSGRGNPAVRFPLKAGLASLTGNDPVVGKCSMPPKLTYTYTFWFKLAVRSSVKTNVMQFNTADGKKLPTVALDVKAGTSDLRMTVAQSNAPNQNCEAVSSVFRDDKPGFLSLNKWVHITMAVSKFHATSSKMTLFVNGKAACTKENTAGTSIEPEDKGLLFLSAAGAAANAEVSLVKFYPKHAFNAAEAAVSIQIEQSDKNLQGAPAEE